MATVSSSPRFTEITLATETAGPFNIGFRLFSTDLRVTVDSEIIDTSAYTLTATFSDGFSDSGVITLDTAQPIGTVVVVESLLLPTRQADYANGDQGLVRKMNIELGRITSLAADLRRDYGRTLRLASNGLDTSTTDTVIIIDANGNLVGGPSVADLADANANAAIAADAAAQVEALTNAITANAVAVDALEAKTVNVTTISGFPATLLDDPDAAAARTTLGLGQLATRNDDFAVKQGGGVGMGTNTINIGWNGAGQLLAQVDGTQLGVIHTSQANADSVGSYMFASTDSDVNFGQLIAGSQLRPTSASWRQVIGGGNELQLAQSGPRGGTWRCMGQGDSFNTLAGQQTMFGATLFLRVA